MKFILILGIFLSFSRDSFVQQGDTVLIRPENLVLPFLKAGNETYIVYNKKTRQGPAQRITLVRIRIEPKTYYRATSSKNLLHLRSYRLHAQRLQSTNGTHQF